MKVKELISQLQKIDQNLDVFCYAEDESDVRMNRILMLIMSPFPKRKGAVAKMVFHG